MGKRIVSSFLATILLVLTVAENSPKLYGAQLQTGEELQDELQAGEKLQDELQTEVVTDEDRTIFTADTQTESLCMVLQANSGDFDVTYTVIDSDDEPIEFTAHQSIEDFDGSIVFDSLEGISDEVMRLYTDSAEEMLLEAFLRWTEILDERELSWQAFGFNLPDDFFEALKHVDEEMPEEPLIAEQLIDAEQSIAAEQLAAEEQLITEEQPATEEQLIAEEQFITEEQPATEEPLTDEEQPIAEEQPVEEEQPVAEETMAEDRLETWEDVFAQESLDSVMPPIDKVDRVSFNYDSLALKVGDSVLLTATYYPENATVSPSWSVRTEDSQYLKVSEKGLVTALKATDSQVKVIYTVGAKTFEIPVTVEDAAIPYTQNEDGVTFGDVPKGLWIGNFKNSLTYTGKAVTQQLDVYFGNELLTLNKDYTLSYKNNVNAADADSLKSPSVTINMKGQYTGKKTMFFAIEQAHMTDVDISGDEISLVYNKKEQNYVPTVTFNGKKLVNKKDFTIRYLSGNRKGEPGNICTITYAIDGIGNYCGTRNGTYYIVDKAKSLNKAAISYKNTYVYDGSSLPSAQDLAKILNLQVKFASDSQIYYPGQDTANFRLYVDYPASITGTGKLTVKADNGGIFRGEVVKSFKITAAYNLGKTAQVTSDFASEIPYKKDTAYNVQQASVGLERKDNGIRLIPGSDYEVSYSANGKVGTATMIFKGIGAYSGTIKKTFKLVNPSPELMVSPSATAVSYLQGGSKVGLTVKSGNGELLTENVDYTVKYTNNTKTGTATYKVTGKGSYAKAAAVTGTYEITAGDISKCSVSVADKAYSAKAGAFKSTPTVTAPNGKKLVAGKDYDKNVVYIYNDCDDSSSDNYNHPAAGSVVNVRIQGINNYEGSTVIGCYRVYDSKAYNISKMYIGIDDKDYTGRAVTIDLDSDVHFYANATDLKKKQNELTTQNAGDCLRIISYKNNIKAGTATVTFGTNLKGSFGYGGTKSVTFKILKKNYDNPRGVTGVTLNASKLTLTSEAFMASDALKAIINPSGALNTKMFWTSSKPGVVEIESISGNTCFIRAKAAGTSVITVTTQDGSRVAKCTVTSVYKPVKSIALSKTSATLYKGESIYLVCNRTPVDAYRGDTESWSSSDESVAEVDDYGTVTAKGAGKATITCKVGTKTAKCTITCPGGKPIERIEMSKATLSMSSSGTYDLSYGIFPADAWVEATPVWSSSDEAVARVDSNGHVTAVGTGFATITVSLEGKQGSCLVAVDSTYIDVKDKGAKGDGIADDTAAINSAIKAAKGTSSIVYIPAGDYNLSIAANAESAIDLDHAQNLRICMDANAILHQGRDSSTNMRGVFVIDWANNVTIEGGVIDCGRGSKSVDEDYFGIMIARSQNISIKNVTVRDSNGDGIYLGKDDYGENKNYNINISGCTVEGCRRNNIALVNAQKVTIDNCHLNNARAYYMSGVSYQVGGLGIDIEPNAKNGSKQYVSDVLIKDCRFSGNRSDFGIHCHQVLSNCPYSKDIVLDGCYFDKMVYIQCGTNVKFQNTRRAPDFYYDERKNSYTFTG